MTKPRIEGDLGNPDRREFCGMAMPAHTLSQTQTLSWDLHLLRQKPESGRKHTSPWKRVRGEKQEAVERLTEATRGGKAELNVDLSDQEA